MKNKALNTDKNNEDVNTHPLLPSEYDLLRSLNTALKFHTLASQILSQFLFMIATYRLGYPSDSNLNFLFDWEDAKNNDLTVTVLPPSPLG